MTKCSLKFLFVSKGDRRCFPGQKPFPERNWLFNPIALRMAKTVWSFGHSECNRVKSSECFCSELINVCCVNPLAINIFSSPKPKAPGQLIV